MDLNNFTIHIYHHVQFDGGPVDLGTLLEGLMGKLNDEVDKLTKAVGDARTAQDAAMQRVTTDVANFNTKITELTQQIADLTQQVNTGQDDPVLIQKIQDLEEQVATLQSQADVLDPTKSDTLPDTPSDDTPPV